MSGGNLITIEVKNTSDKRVGRGGVVFAPLSTTTTVVSKYSYFEIKSHNDLKVKKLEGIQNPSDNSEDITLKVTPKGNNELNLDNPETSDDGEESEEVEEVEGEEYNCPYCDESFDKRKKLVEHVKANHKEMKEDFKQRFKK